MKKSTKSIIKIFMILNFVALIILLALGTNIYKKLHFYQTAQEVEGTVFRIDSNKSSRRHSYVYSVQVLYYVGEESYLEEVSYVDGVYARELSPGQKIMVKYNPDNKEEISIGDSGEKSIKSYFISLFSTTIWCIVSAIIWILIKRRRRKGNHFSDKRWAFLYNH